LNGKALDFTANKKAIVVTARIVTMSAIATAFFSWILIPVAVLEVDQQTSSSHDQTKQ
jgi:hypothetical protein